MSKGLATYLDDFANELQNVMQHVLHCSQCVYVKTLAQDF